MISYCGVLLLKECQKEYNDLFSGNNLNFKATASKNLVSLILALQHFNNVV